MKNSTVITLFTTALLSTPIMTQADTFSVTIALTDVRTGLVLTEATPMKFPTIIIDGKKGNGQTCYSYTTNNSSLCPDAAVGNDKHNASFTVAGTPLDTVSISFTPPDNLNGLQLHVWGSTTSVVLDGSGAGAFQARAWLKLVDITAVRESTKFDYEVIVTYS